MAPAAPISSRGSAGRATRAGAPRALCTTVALAGLTGLLVLGGCGGDDAPADERDRSTGATGTVEEGDVTNDDWPQAEGVTLEAQISPGDRHVSIAFTITNTGDVPIAVPDPETTPDRASELGDGTVRVSFLGPEGAGGGGDPAPPGEGVLLAPGAVHSGTATALTRGGDLPEAVDVCVEVVTDVHADDDGDGLVTFPYRPTAEPPTVACSGPASVG